MTLVIGTSLLFISVVFLNSIQLSFQSENKNDLHNRRYNNEVRPLIPIVQVPENADLRNIRPSTVPNDIVYFPGNIPPEAAEFLRSRALLVPYGQFHRIENNPVNERVLREHDGHVINVGTSEQHIHIVKPSENEDNSQSKNFRQE